MKPILQFLLVPYILVAFASCSGSKDIDTRRYNSGYYHDFKLVKNKVEKTDPAESATPEIVKTDSLTVLKTDKTLEKVNNVLKTMIDLSTQKENVYKAHMNENHGVIADRFDSIIAKSALKDTSWFADTIAPSVETALASQAFLGFVTIGAIATLAVPELIWFTLIPTLLSPIALLISLIACMIALRQLGSGKIPASNKKYLKLWAVMLLVNVLLAALVITQQTWF